MISELSIKLNDIHLYGFHGVDELENKIGNEFIITLCVKLPSRKDVAITDVLEDSISYADLYDILKQEFEIPSKLIEHVAGRVVSRIVQRWPNVSHVTIEISKIAPPIPGVQGSASILLTLDNNYN